MNNREKLKDKQRIVVKVGTSSLIHKATGNINLFRLEKLVRVLTDLHNSGKDVILVSSGAIGVGFKALGLENRPTSLPMKQACSAVGQGHNIFDVLCPWEDIHWYDLLDFIIF